MYSRPAGSQCSLNCRCQPESDATRRRWPAGGGRIQAHRCHAGQWQPQCGRMPVTVPARVRASDTSPKAGPGGASRRPCQLGSSRPVAATGEAAQANFAAVKQARPGRRRTRFVTSYWFLSIRSTVFDSGALWVGIGHRSQMSVKEPPYMLQLFYLAMPRTGCCILIPCTLRHTSLCKPPQPLLGCNSRKHSLRTLHIFEIKGPRTRFRRGRMRTLQRRPGGEIGNHL